MKRYGNLFGELCSWKNLEEAWKKARKGKTQRPDVQEFSKNWENNLHQLQIELLLHAYRPRPMVQFIVRDPKTRKISKSDFRDRVVHHALCNIIEPIFESIFIHDSFANRKGKGILAALQRFEHFKRKILQAHGKVYVLKADIRKYFDEVDHLVLLTIIKKKIKDSKILRVICLILNNHKGVVKGKGSANQRFAGLFSLRKKGMPLGNLTSQFFANVYLNELDQYVKRELRAKYYIRYVDDFVILHQNPKVLEQHKQDIATFLMEKLRLTLHPNKCRIVRLERGVLFLGFRIFLFHTLLRKANIWKLQKRLFRYKAGYDAGETGYDVIYETLQGWLAYAMHGNTYKLRKRIMVQVERDFPNELATIEYNRYLKLLQKKK